MIPFEREIYSDLTHREVTRENQEIVTEREQAKRAAKG